GALRSGDRDAQLSPGAGLGAPTALWRGAGALHVGERHHRAYARAAAVTRDEAHRAGAAHLEPDNDQLRLVERIFDGAVVRDDDFRTKLVGGWTVPGAGARHVDVGEDALVGVEAW